jgi:hypothetical protein
MSTALISGNLKLQQTSSPGQACTGIAFLFRIFYANFTAMFYISFVISGIYKAVNISILVFYCVTSFILVIAELSEEIAASGFRVYLHVHSMYY